MSTDRVVFAIRDVAADEEITIDARLNAYADPDPWVMACACDPARGSHGHRRLLLATGGHASPLS
jgi:hypothetical protein